MAGSQRRPIPYSLVEIRQQIELGLDHYLQTKGPERHALTLHLMRLKWAAEDREGGAGGPLRSGK